MTARRPGTPAASWSPGRPASRCDSPAVTPGPAGRPRSGTACGAARRSREGSQQGRADGDGADGDGADGDGADGDGPDGDGADRDGPNRDGADQGWLGPTN